MAAIAGLVCIAGTSCVFPARSFAAYEGKAVSSASSTAAAVETALLSVEVATDGKTTAAFTSVAIADAEGDANSAQQTFDSIQPPDARSDALRAELDQILSDAVDGISTLRIAARRGELDRLSKLAQPLHQVNAELARFQARHS